MTGGIIGDGWVLQAKSATTAEFRTHFSHSTRPKGVQPWINVCFDFDIVILSFCVFHQEYQQKIRTALRSPREAVVQPAVLRKYTFCRFCWIYILYCFCVLSCSPRSVNKSFTQRCDRHGFYSARPTVLQKEILYFFHVSCGWWFQ